MRTAMGCALILAALSSVACHTMRPVTLDQLRGIGPRQVRVTRADQSVEIVSRPQVMGDTLVGFVNRTYQVIPAADLKQVLVRQSAPRRTALLAVAGVLGFVGFTRLFTSSGPPAAPTQSKCDIVESGSNVECPQN